MSTSRILFLLFLLVSSLCCSRLLCCASGGWKGMWMKVWGQVVHALLQSKAASSQAAAAVQADLACKSSWAVTNLPLETALIPGWTETKRKKHRRQLAVWEAGLQRSCSAMGTLCCHFHLSCTSSSSSQLCWCGVGSLGISAAARAEFSSHTKPCACLRARSGDGQGR